MACMIQDAKAAMVFSAPLACFLFAGCISVNVGGGSSTPVPYTFESPVEPWEAVAGPADARAFRSRRSQAMMVVSKVGDLRL